MVVCVVRLMERESLFRGFVLAGESRFVAQVPRPSGGSVKNELGRRQTTMYDNLRRYMRRCRGERDLQMVCKSISNKACLVYWAITIGAAT